MRMPYSKAFLLLLLSGSFVSFVVSFGTTQTQNQDVVIGNWCNSVGIQTFRACELKTTDRSVAGRGIFALKDISEGETVLSIPESIIFHEFNGATKYPNLGQSLVEDEQTFLSRNDRRTGIRARLRRLASKPFRRQQREAQHFNDNFVDISDFWQFRLTLLSLLASSQEDDEWKLWITSWERDDPYHHLLSSGATYQSKKEIDLCAKELHRRLPDVPVTIFQAAIEIRLRRLDALLRMYEKSIDMIRHECSISHKDMVNRYSVLCSRAIELGTDITAVIPMHDMVNHSKEPNLAMGFDAGGNVELVAVRNIANGDELFIKYTKDDEWDATQAAWTFIQWGIAEVKP